MNDRLFDPDPDDQDEEERPDANTLGKFRKDHPDTSRRSAVHVYPRTGSQRLRVLEHVLATGGATDQEVQSALGLSGDSERPRRIELVEGGWVVGGGERDGKTVWIPTPKALIAAIPRSIS